MDLAAIEKKISFDQRKTKAMINGFESETCELNLDEIAICDYVVKRLRHNTGKDNAVTSKKIMSKINESLGVKIDGSRLRKIVNHIRRNDLLPGLVASSLGYYIETDREEILKYIQSLRQRAEAIMAVANSMQRDADQLKIFNPYKNETNG